MWRSFHNVLHTRPRSHISLNLSPYRCRSNSSGFSINTEDPTDTGSSVDDNIQMISLEGETDTISNSRRPGQQNPEEEHGLLPTIAVLGETLRGIQSM